MILIAGSYQIDFNAVGAAANLNPPAARMRFTRLKKAIESGSITNTAGTSTAVPAVESCTSSVAESGETPKRKNVKPRPRKGLLSAEADVETETNQEKESASTKMEMRPRSTTVKMEMQIDE